MKNQWLFTLLFLPLFFHPARAQYLVEEGKQWNIAVYPTFTPNTTSYSLRIGGEVVINDTIYHEILQSNDSLNSDWIVLNRYLREDTLHRVYMRSNNSTEQVLYDFSLTTGDTFFTENQCHVTVLETDSITLNNGDVRKRLKVERVPSFGFDYWVQGIGSTLGGLLSHFGLHCYTDYSVGLLCHYEGGELVYPADPPSCFIVSTEELSPVDGVSVFPNPVREYLFIEGREDLLRASLYTPTGSLVLQQRLTSGGNTVLLTKLPPGLYFLVIENNQKQRRSVRLVKM